MTKEEFDKASTEAGFGPSAAHIWPAIEDCHSTSDEIDRDLEAVADAKKRKAARRG